MPRANLPQLHDWEVTGLDVDRMAKTVTIKLWLPETGLKSHLLLSGVSSFYSSDWMLQNVILDFMIFKEPSNSDYYDHCCQVLCLEKGLLNDSDQLLFIESSTGAELACCCESFALQKIN